MAGWFRLSRRVKFHHFKPHTNEMLLVSNCCRYVINRAAAPRLRTYLDLPAAAQLCRGCTAMEKAA